MTKRFKSQTYRLFQYTDCCVQARKVIDLNTALDRGLVDANGRGVCRVSDDLVDLGNYTERGHKRVNCEAVASYFA